ncbi:MAG: protein kinase [Deltaproteobacteria bacterium]|nr:protein kinase [Deltaproteobacteria bacterium]
MKFPCAFGKYILLDKIASGGMAEIFKAKTVGVSGFEKILAIKRIHPQFAQNQEFITMLIDEAKISVFLNHSNIVQVFDLGRIGEHYFIAMEYVNGIDLHKYIKKCKQKKQYLPIDISIFIASEVAKGLDYAHRKRDPEGKPLNIIHRDVSPQNILISDIGEVKITDFGIAKANIKSKETTKGLLKGKINYMSPEQASGLEIDNRSDIYALGIILYEMFTNQRPFYAESDYKQIEMIKKGIVKSPVIYREDLPDELADIVMKCLARDRDARYQAASDLQSDLQKYLFKTYPGFVPSKLQDFTKKFFGKSEETTKVIKKDNIAEKMTRVDFAVDTSESLITDEKAEITRKTPTPYKIQTAKTPDAEPTISVTKPTIKERVNTASGDIFFRILNFLNNSAMTARETGRVLTLKMSNFFSDIHTNPVKLILTILSSVAVILTIVIFMMLFNIYNKPLTPLNPSYMYEINQSNQQPNILHLKNYYSAPIISNNKQDKSTYTESETSPNIGTTLKKENKKGIKKTKKTTQTKTALAASVKNPGLLSVNSKPWGEVYINGRPTGQVTPLKKYEIKPGKYNIKVFFTGSNRFSESRTVTVKAGEETIVPLFKDEDQ